MAPKLLKPVGPERPRSDSEAAIDALLQRGVDVFGWPDHDYSYVRPKSPGAPDTQPRLIPAQFGIEKSSLPEQAQRRDVAATNAEAEMPIPPGASLHENIRLAMMNRNSPMWFYEQTRNGGPWDYKQIDPKYEAFGNFNYGLTGLAAGFSRSTLERMAGWAQTRAGTSDSSFGEPAGFVRSYAGFGGDWPFGDDPRDNYWIKRGFDYFDLLRHGARGGGGAGW